MPEFKTYRCDCGCGQGGEPWQLRGWFILTQPEEVAAGDNHVRLYDHKKLYFYRLDHLQRWLETAVPEASRLLDAVRVAQYPRGNYVSKDRLLVI
ncbi:hypothetical protein KW784_02285 [Candidatus Parcubacteria bacterium]|nr:hypothetical protein [Candidatus Parcubacteria bacterium]